jgi:hypothetical protein
VSLGPYAELEFDLAGALRNRLVQMFDSMPTAPLDRASVDATVPNQQGVYQLFHEGELVYIGKTDAQAGLRSRLQRHSDKILHRLGLDPSAVSFKAIRLFVFTVMDLETELLQAHKPAWNGRGFGSNDPGRERDTTRIKAVNFDARFPIDIHRQIEVALEPGVSRSAESALVAVQAAVPWKLRRQNLGGKSRKCHIELENTLVSLSGESRTGWDFISEIVKQLPAGWQATALKSHVILYKEGPKEYPDPLAVSLSSGVGT